MVRIDLNSGRNRKNQVYEKYIFPPAAISTGNIQRRVRVTAAERMDDEVYLNVDHTKVCRQPSDFQMQIYLKDVDKETRNMMASFQIQNSSFISERDLTGFQILGHLSVFQTIVHLLKAKAETASKYQKSLQGFMGLVHGVYANGTGRLYTMARLIEIVAHRQVAHQVGKAMASAPLPPGCNNLNLPG
ncbi:hypothetical protein NDU88_006942 [Pleurodeles waltl]|uniref:Uncharacterized protein n=1 Tax=Pleurodeles waltl TaxID=8319 RepID=A0AAV7WHT5_PLEWA|nr:hypothetical protein NDU88_006942 [Pleurodeles waltl]